jgi:hypothetical protein
MQAPAQPRRASFHGKRGALTMASKKSEPQKPAKPQAKAEPSKKAEPRRGSAASAGSSVTSRTRLRRQPAAPRPFRGGCRAGVGDHRPAVSIFRYLAARHQHGNDHRHLLDGVLIQNSQNRDSAAIQVKLDDLIRASTAH